MTSGSSGSPGSLSRRAFLAGSACAGLLLRFWPRSWWPAVACVCGATIRAAHRLREDPAEPAGFCPNCGRSLARGTFKLRAQGWSRAADAAKPASMWNSAQVPFPNPRLVQSTDKPRVTMAKVRV